MVHKLPPVRLIVNADDFGLTHGINRAVGEMSRSGALSSATMMAGGNACADAVRVADAPGRLGVGCHVVLVDGTPCAAPGTVRSLLASDGRLQTSLVSFLVALQRGRIAEREIEAEAFAQIRRLQDAGVHVTHVDTHKHTHLFPRVARPLLRAAMRCGVHAVRNPFEQAWSASLTRGALLRKLEVHALRSFQSSFRQLLRASGLKSTDGSIGVSATGKLDRDTLARLLQHAPAGTWELVCHPGYNDAELDTIATRLRGTRDVERDALTALIPEAVQSGRVQLISFADL